MPTIQRFGAGLSMVSLVGCTPVDLGFLNPAGPVSHAQRELFLWIAGLSLVVVLPVIVLTPWLLWRYRYGRSDATYQPKWAFSLPLEILSWGVPGVIVVLLGWLAWHSSHELDPYRALPGSGNTLEIQVIALDWKWLFIYPQQGLATVNQLVIPVNRPVHLNLTSASVMQALAIPRLSGQIYAMAGMRTQQYLQADQVGDFAGRNVQYNGKGFQEQSFAVHAMTAHQFDGWMTELRQTGRRMDCDTYAALNRMPALHQVQQYGEVQPGLFDGVVRASYASSTPTCGAPLERHRHE